MRQTILIWKIPIGKIRLVVLACCFYTLLNVMTLGNVMAFSAHWLPLNDKLEPGVSAHLLLVFENCSPQDEVKPPKVAFLEIEAPSISRNSRKELIYDFPIIPHQPGNYIIPPFLISTDHGLVEIPPISFTVKEVEIAPISADGVDAQVLVPQRTLWKGEPFVIEYRLLTRSGTFLDITSQPEWDPKDFLSNRWGKPQRVILNANGTYASGIRYTTTLLSLKAGKIVLPPISQQLTLEIERFGRGLFSQPIVKPIHSTTEPKVIEIAPLPAAPPDFSEAIGTFKLSCKVNPVEAIQGEPISLSIRIEGTGNWAVPWKLPEYPPCKGIRIINSLPSRQIDPESLFTGVLKMELVLIPDIFGEIDLPAYSFTYFEVTQGEYQTIKSDPIHLSVKKSSLSNQTPDNKLELLTDRSQPINTGYPLDMLPTGPLLGMEKGLAPFPPWDLGKESLLFAFIFLFLWCLLCWDRVAHKPLLLQKKKASHCLRTIPQAIAKAKTNEEIYRYLLLWQKAFKEFWDIPYPFPDEDSIEKQLIKDYLKNSVMAKKWAALWNQSQLYLFGRLSTPSSQWIDEAQELARKLPKAKIPLKEFFTTANFLPFLSLSIFVGLFSSILTNNLKGSKNPGGPLPFSFTSNKRLPSSASSLLFCSLADPPSDSKVESFTSEEAYRCYEKGEFSKAIDIWKKKTLVQPLDWKTRNNLGLAFSQQEQWQRALGEWTAAFLLAPRNASVRWNLTVGINKNPEADTHIHSFKKKGYFNSLKIFLSPGEWERVAAISIFLLFFFLCILLLHLYQKIRIPAFCFSIVLVLAFISSLSLLEFFSYGIFATPNAGMLVEDTPLRSVPTEVQQQSLPVKAGSVIRVIKAYLGWYKIEFMNGQNGWVRSQCVTLFYKTPHAFVSEKEKAFYLSIFHN
ncbi:BatD family protein [Methylacidiphilum sp. Yel]|uniref:BatD family protein n=1 Tax=Methylacidiphilum sp. Yel TaxID=1847730 RepID=UPI001FCA3774|nr:BatD family protein [Methylacidiphilum sp. Yel]